mmetsp:Transcript_65087/g.89465  ORF Transcript_65087/g.89465 Transcript_65087/m.89465 type:complete len:138 (-) Transcript_65087:273-686(-)
MCILHPSLWDKGDVSRRTEVFTCHSRLSWTLLRDQSEHKSTMEESKADLLVGMAPDKGDDDPDKKQATENLVKPELTLTSQEARHLFAHRSTEIDQEMGDEEEFVWLALSLSVPLRPLVNQPSSEALRRRVHSATAQ